MARHRADRLLTNAETEDLLPQAKEALDRWNALTAMPADATPLNEHMWIGENALPNCMTCYASFSFIRRRHHCRRCGALVCGACSKKTMKTSDGVDHRVCDGCYNTLHFKFKAKTLDSTEHVKQIESHVRQIKDRQRVPGEGPLGKAQVPLQTLQLGLAERLALASSIEDAKRYQVPSAQEANKRVQFEVRYDKEQLTDRANHASMTRSRAGSTSRSPATLGTPNQSLGRLSRANSALKTPTQLVLNRAPSMAYYSRSVPNPQGLAQSLMNGSSSNNFGPATPQQNTPSRLAGPEVEERKSALSSSYTGR